MDLRVITTTVPCAKCQDPVGVKHFAHATVDQLRPSYHLACAAAICIDDM